MFSNHIDSIREDTNGGAKIEGRSPDLSVANGGSTGKTEGRSPDLFIVNKGSTGKAKGRSPEIYQPTGKKK